MAKPKHAVIYIPGLGDRNRLLLWVQRQLLRGWRTAGVRGHIFTMRWTSDESIKPRVAELSEYIDRLREEGYVVSLMGASAGASAAISMFAQRPDAVAAAISLSGQLRGADKVVNQALDLNPRFKESLDLMNRHLDKLDQASRQRILTYRVAVDAIVPPSHSTLDGANNRRLWIVGHNLGIVWVLSAKGRGVARFIRAIAKQ